MQPNHALQLFQIADSAMTQARTTIACAVTGVVTYLVRTCRSERRLHLLLMAVCIVGLSTQSQPGDIMSAESGGNSSLSVNPGDSFSVDVVMSSDTSDTSTSVLFTVEFDRAGPVYDSYLWSSRFAANDIFLDDTIGEVPLMLRPPGSRRDS